MREFPQIKYQHPHFRYSKSIVALDTILVFINYFNEVSIYKIMTGGCERGDYAPKIPVISIQSDWDDVIFSTNQEIWISCKFLGQGSTNSKLRNQGKNSIISASPDFSVVSFTQNAIIIKYNPSGHVYGFASPLKTFTKIHNKKVVSLNVAEKGLGVSVCAENKLLVWSSTTGNVLQTLSGHVCNVYKCKFFPSGIVVLSGGADMQLKIWSAETGECPVTLIGHRAPINDFCMVDRGRNIISVSNDGSAKLWDCGKSACLSTIFESSEVLNCCAITILPGCYDYLQREEPVSEREINTSDKLLIIGTESCHVYGLAIFSRKVVFTIKTDSAVNMVLVLVDKIVVGCHNGKVEVYKISNVQTPEKVWHESASPILCGCTHKEIGFWVGRNDGTVTYYDCDKFSEKRISLTGSDFDPITDISCSNNKIFTACRDGKIRQYSLGDLVNKLISS